MPNDLNNMVKEEEVLLCFGCYCCNFGAYAKDYIGCANEFSCCCVETLCCLKVGQDPLWCKCGHGSGKYFRFGLGFCSVGIVYPRACCVSSGQFCCFAWEGIVPTDDDFARTCAFLGVMCKPTCGLFPRLSTVERGPWYKDQDPAPPTTTTQQPQAAAATPVV